MNSASIVHIAVDMQERFVCGLQRRFSGHDKPFTFPADVKNFSSSLKEAGIPTIWVACNELSETAYYSEKIIDPRVYPKPSNLACLGVSYRMTGHEDIFSKRDSDAFDDPLLANILKGRGIDTVLITGLYTGCCIAESVRGAVRNGFRCIVAIDLLADYALDKNADSQMHLSHLQNTLNGPGDRKIDFLPMTSKQVLELVKVLHTQEIFGVGIRELMMHTKYTSGLANSTILSSPATTPLTACDPFRPSAEDRPRDHPSHRPTELKAPDFK